MARTECNCCSLLAEARLVENRRCAVGNEIRRRVAVFFFSLDEGGHERRRSFDGCMWSCFFVLSTPLDVPLYTYRKDIQ